MIFNNKSEEKPKKENKEFDKDELFKHHYELMKQDVPEFMEVLSKMSKHASNLCVTPSRHWTGGTDALDLAKSISICAYELGDLISNADKELERTDN